MSREPTENPFPGSRTTSAPSGVTCAQCGVPWSLDVRAQHCPMAPEHPHYDGVAVRHLFAQGVTAPEVERLRRIEAAARAVVAVLDMAPALCRPSTRERTVEDLRTALEPLK